MILMKEPTSQANQKVKLKAIAIFNQYWSYFGN